VTWEFDGEKTSHVPVLYKEVLDGLAVKANSRYVDCTVGGGGHSRGILERSSPAGLLLGLDADPQALEVAEERLRRYGHRVLLINENFRNLKRITEELRFGPADGILLDLGISSIQLANGRRGFSFQAEGPLDMRLGPEVKISARDLVNDLSEDELTILLARYGEVDRPRKLARAIMAKRPVETTSQLSAIAERAHGRRGRIHPATNLFRALRMSVNDELGALAEALPEAVEILGPEGCLVVISYHSLEDRVVKHFLQRESRNCLCPPEVLKCSCGHEAKLRILTRKPIVPSPQEARRNPRARSAKLRIASRLV
jgi:16S rRNA (cytosine1402-N4)-methyltransferase